MSPSKLAERQPVLSASPSRHHDTVEMLRPEDRPSRLATIGRHLDRRVEALPPWFVVTQLFFGLGWARAAAAKVISIDWWTGSTIVEFVADHNSATLGWFQPVADLAATNPIAMALAVVVAQLFAAVSMITNRAFGWGLAVASMLNLSFVAIGAVNPSAFYLIGQGAMMLWLVGRAKPTEALSAALRFGVAIGIALAAVSAPFLKTVHPATVIDDPAAMIMLFGALSAIAGELTHRALFNRSLP